VIIGGASLYGGRGNMFGTFVGTLIPVVLLQGFVILGVNPYLQNVAIGLVLLIAVAIEQRDRRKSRIRAETVTASSVTQTLESTDYEEIHEMPQPTQSLTTERNAL